MMMKTAREEILKTSGGIIQKTKNKLYGTIDLLDILIIYKEELLKKTRMKKYTDLTHLHLNLL